MSTQFRKKPVVIEAVQFDGTLVSLQGFALAYVTQDLGSKTCQIPTEEGEMTVQPGDWVIQGVMGEFYPCKPGIFAMTYDPVAAPLPAAPAPTELTPDAERSVDYLMEAISCFASEWSLVGGRFDKGEMLEQSGETKQRIRRILEDDARKLAAAVTSQPVAALPTDQDEELPITRSTYGSLEACEAEQARRVAALPAEQAPTEQEIDSLFSPPKAMLNREDWDIATRKPKITQQAHVMPPFAAPASPIHSSDEVLKFLRNAHDALEGTADSDIDHFEDENEEREAVPVQYAARKVMQAIYAIAARQVDGAVERDARKAGALHEALLRACTEMPYGYLVRVEAEKDAGTVEWEDSDGETHLIDGEGYLSDDVTEAIDAAIEHAQEKAS